MARYSIEHTDTFGGEPNYCWAHRYEFHGTKAQAIRAAKAAIGWTGLHCSRRYMSGYGHEYRRPGVCQVLYVTWMDSSAPQFGTIIGKDGNPIDP